MTRFWDFVYLAGISNTKVWIPWLAILSLSASSRYTWCPGSVDSTCAPNMARGNRGKELHLTVIFRFKQKESRSPLRAPRSRSCRPILREGASSMGVFRVVSAESAPLLFSSVSKVGPLSVPGIDVYLPRIPARRDRLLPRRRLSIRYHRDQATANYSLVILSGFFAGPRITGKRTRHGGIMAWQWI